MKDYRPDVDGLRALAVLSVLLCHAGLGMPGGYVGVDVFFVISGYLITGLIVKELNAGTFSLIDFWERRTRRIVPALAVVVFCTLAAGWFVLLPSDLANVSKSAVAVALLAANVHFWQETGYFAAAAASKPLLHTWSLAVEEQFYLIVPLCLMALARLGRRGMLLAMYLACGASFGLSVYGVANHPDATYYLLPTRAWELLVGAILACGQHAAKGRFVAEAGAWIGMFAILIPCWTYGEDTPFPGFAAVPPVLGAALIIACHRPGAPLPLVNRFLSWRPVVFIGLISYSLYLWHWPLLVYARSLAPLGLTLSQRIYLAAISFALAVSSWALVETPFRKRRLLPTRRAVFISGTACYLSVVVCGGYIFINDGFQDRLPPGARTIAETSKREQKYTTSYNLRHIPHGLPRYGAAGQTPTALVWGDSHAMAVLPAFDYLGRQYGVSVTAAVHSSTAPVLGFCARQRYGLNERDAPAYGEAVLALVKQQRIRAVILAGSWGVYARMDGFLPALFDTVDALKRAGTNVYFVKDPPRFPYDVPSVLTTYTWHGWDLRELTVPISEYDAWNAFHKDVLPALRRRGVVVLDPVPYFMDHEDPQRLAPFDDAGSRYYDSHHLSTHGALAIREAFTPLFANLSGASIGTSLQASAH